MKKQLLDVAAWAIILITALTLIGVINVIFYKYIGFDGMLSLFTVGILSAGLIWAFSRVAKT